MQMELISLGDNPQHEPHLPARSNSQSQMTIAKSWMQPDAILLSLEKRHIQRQKINTCALCRLYIKPSIYVNYTLSLDDFIEVMPVLFLLR